MITPPPWLPALDQAELLRDLLDCFLAGRSWTLDERKDARILVGLLGDYSKAAEVAAWVNTLERKLWDDAEP